MALKRLPQRIFKDTLVLHVPTAFDRYQKPTSEAVYTISNAHAQADNKPRKTKDHTEATLKGKVWIYPPYSTPMVDVEAMQEQVQKAGGVMTCTINSKDGSPTGPYTVLEVNAYPDDCDNLHHIMLGLV